MVVSCGKWRDLDGSSFSWDFGGSRRLDADTNRHLGGNMGLSWLTPTSTSTETAAATKVPSFTEVHPALYRKALMEGAFLDFDEAAFAGAATEAHVTTEVPVGIGVEAPAPPEVPAKAASMS
jgi:hypothetical protein